MTLYQGLVIMHIIGTVLGVGAATFAEIFFIKFNRDNILSDDEKGTMATVYTVLRFGLFLLVISGFGFFLYYRLTEYFEPLSNPAYWAKMTLVGILVVNAWLLQTRKVPLAVGSAVSLTSWYSALILGVIANNMSKGGATYIDIMLVYVVMVAVVGFILAGVRKHFEPKPL